AVMSWVSAETRARFRRNLSLQVGLAMLVALALLILLAPLFTHLDTSEVNFDRALLPPSGDNWFGTDDLGRDVFARVVAAAGIDLQIAVICVFVPFVIGSAVGLVSGYVGGMTDVVLMRIVDVLWAFPFYVLVIAIVGSLGPSLLNMYMAFTLVAWISFARIVRGEVLLV